MNFQWITLTINDGVAVLTLNQPKILNSLSIELVEEMRTAIAAVSQRDDVKSLMLTGTGRSFCAGAELSPSSFMSDSENTIGQRVGQRMQAYFNPLIMDIRNLPIPVIAAVNGTAAGAGVSLALAADITIAARSASFILTFVPRLGIIPDLGATWHLPRLIGRARAQAIALLGNKLDAQKATDWGLIWQCVDDDALMTEAHALAIRLGKIPRLAIAELRQAFDAAELNDLAAQLDYEWQRQEVLVDTEDFKEGLQSFLEKREPVFQGR